MFMETMNENFKKSIPIFADEILGLFPNYSKQYVYRMINEAVDNGSLKFFCRGIYFIPEKTFFGSSSINPDQIIKKKYTQNGNEIFGLYSGLALLNSFGITTQMPNTIEIVTNNEATRKREIQIADRRYLLRKSRCEINRNNLASYVILQLFSDMNDNDRLDASSIKRIKQYMANNGIALKNLVDMASYFPGKAVKRMMRSEIFYDAI